MIDAASFSLFLAAALVIAVSPGPGLLYVAARTLAGGRSEGIASSVGTGIGGLVHVAAGALGASAVVMASADAFTVLKLVGAAYLVWLGIRTFRSASLPVELLPAGRTGRSRALREGILVEALNPKTAAFFLAFIPQFIDPAAGQVALQFLLLGTISVLLNTGMDVIVACSAATVRTRLLARPAVIRRLRQASGALICGLGAVLALARRPG
jgi:threonine/homoserine/homoserine lactone efflux protein